MASRRLLSSDQDEYLRQIAYGRSVRECTRMLNDRFGTEFKESQIGEYKKNHKILSGMHSWKFVDHSKQNIMTKEQADFVKKEAAGKSNQELTDIFNERFGTDLTVRQIKAYKHNHGISSGLTGYFEKGHIPVNKNTKGMFNVGGNRTSYKNGNIPKKTLPIGTEKVLKDGYVWVKVNDQSKPKNKRVNWIPKHQLVYEKNYGKVPERYDCMFLDGNNRNFNIENIAIVTKAERLYLNRYKLISSDPEITKSGIVLARTMCKVSNIRKRKEKGNEK